MPRIVGGTIAQNREMRWAAILDAAEEILRTGSELTLGAVARQVGIGRTAVYRYVSGADELIAILATRGFPEWTASVARAMGECDGNRERAIAWARESVNQGRAADHAWLSTLGQMELSDESRAQIARGHQEIERLLRIELEALGISEIDVVVRALQALVSAATKQPPSERVDEFYAQAFGAVIDSACSAEL